MRCSTSGPATLAKARKRIGATAAITGEGKPSIQVSSDPEFRGDPARYNPEELLVASLSSWQMRWYLHLCSVNQVTVQAYRDSASGTMRENENGSGQFIEVTLKPLVKVSFGDDSSQTLALHDEAHRLHRKVAKFCGNRGRSS